MPIVSFRSVPVLVTGGAGFIGSHLVEELIERDAEVRVLDNFSTGRRENLSGNLERIELIEGDIRDLETCRRACEGMTFVLHQAALGSVPVSMDDPATCLAINVGGTANLFAAAREARVRRIVYASSSSVYGDSAQLPKQEGSEGAPLSPYALSKQMDEQLADTFGRCFGMDLIGLRYFNVYGPRQDPNGPYAAVVPRFFMACRAGLPPTIYGDGSQIRDFVYVGDVVRANLLALSAPTTSCGRAYNIGAGGKTDIRTIASIICDVTRTTLAPQFAPPRPGDVLRSQADTTLARDALEFESRVDLEEGLRTMGTSSG